MREEKVSFKMKVLLHTPKSRSEEDKPHSPDFSLGFDRAGATKTSRRDCPEKSQSSADTEISN